MRQKLAIFGVRGVCTWQTATSKGPFWTCRVEHGLRAFAFAPGSSSRVEYG
jgi:hypothetical protein